MGGRNPFFFVFTLTLGGSTLVHPYSLYPMSSPRPAPVQPMSPGILHGRRPGEAAQEAAEPDQEEEEGEEGEEGEKGEKLGVGEWFPPSSPPPSSPPLLDSLGAHFVAEISPGSCLGLELYWTYLIHNIIILYIEFIKSNHLQGVFFDWSPLNLAKSQD